MKIDTLNVKIANAIEQYNETVKRMVKTDVSWVMMAWLGLDIVNIARECGLNVQLDRDTNMIVWNRIQNEAP